MKIFVTSALAEITSSETFVLEKAPWRLHRQVAVSGPRTAPDADLILVHRAENLNSIMPLCKLPLRNFLGSVLPGLAELPHKRVAELTPTACAARS